MPSTEQVVPKLGQHPQVPAQGCPQRGGNAHSHCAGPSWCSRSRQDPAPTTHATIIPKIPAERAHTLRSYHAARRRHVRYEIANDVGPELVFKVSDPTQPLAKRAMSRAPLPEGASVALQPFVRRNLTSYVDL